MGRLGDSNRPAEHGPVSGRRCCKPAQACFRPAAWAEICAGSYLSILDKGLLGGLGT